MKRRRNLTVPIVIFVLFIGNIAAAQGRALPVTFFEPLPLVRARQDELRDQRIVQLAADEGYAKKRAAVEAIKEKDPEPARPGGVKQKAAEPRAADAKAADGKGADGKDADGKAAAAKAVMEKIDPLAKARKEREEAENAQVLQYIQLLTPTLWVELDFIRQTCELPPAVRPKIKEAGEEGVKQAAREVAQPRRANQRTQRTTQAGATIVIREALTKALQESLSAEEFKKYNEEATQRVAHRKEAAILSAVSRMDSLLCLNGGQRDKIVASIAAGWQPEWEGWLQLHQYGAQYFPQVAEQHVVAHLNEEQKTVWRGVSKISVNSWGGDNGRAQDVQWWEGKAAAAPAAAANVDIQEIR